MRQLYLALVLALSGGLSALGQPATKTQARLLLEAQSARPGETVMAGVHLKMAPGWHTYWKNSGDSGAGTTIDWTLPAGVEAGDIQWPVPEKYVEEGFTTYVYHGDVVLLVPLKLAADLKPGKLNLQAKVSWLECEKLCLPGNADLRAELAVGTGSQRSANAEMLAAWAGKVPRPEPAAARAWWEKKPGDEPRPLAIEWPAAGKDVDFFPYAHEQFEVSGDTEVVSAGDGKARVRKVVNKFGDRWPERVSGLLVKNVASDERSAIEVELQIGNAPGEGSGMPAEVGVGQKSFWLMLLGAFVGGLILNIMPCVLPVISLKILGFVNQSKESPAQIRKLGMVYTLGVLASFLVLAGLVIAVQQAGQLASWGMQFQNPYFLVFMTVLVTLVALNLFGWFEISLGGQAMGTATALAGKEGTAGAFFHGVLMTALATPCTAPFLGVALGFAFTQSAPLIALMFLTVGLGLASPYLILSWRPQWLRFLPRPGAWMERFKKLMGFPMFATAVWLFWLATRHFGSRGALWLGMFLVILAMAVWIWGEFVQRGRAGRGIAAAISVLVLIAGYSYTLEHQLDWRSRETFVAAVEAGGRKSEIPWNVWTPQAVAQARAAGRPVLVDFTADWCVTCQVNKKTSIEIQSVTAKLKEVEAVALLGDYTLGNPEIAAELKRYGRAGVPLVLVYSADTNKPPEILPEVLTPGIVLNALERAAQTSSTNDETAVSKWQTEN